MNIIRRLTLSFLLVLFSVSAQAEQQASDVEPFSQAELEQILAPIALYPDTVLSHILVASTYPLEVIQAERWTKKNTGLNGSDAVEAVDNKDWDPSVKALVAFPQILTRLSDNLEWTEKLGDAFLQDEEKVLTSVQSLRQRAYEAGNLDNMDKMKVTHEDSAIVIEPVEREIVYVPYYDTRVVYGPWYWSQYPPVYWQYPHYVNHYYVGHHSPFYWGPSVHVSFGFFFSDFYWNDYHVVRIPYQYYDRHHYYSRRQIIHNQHVRRWAHNPVHRRGVSYRSVTVSNRYRSNRASQAEVRTYRNAGGRSITASSRVGNNRNSSHRRSNSHRENSETTANRTRIASPDRIREELRDGRISIKERNSRPITQGNSRNSSSSNHRQSNQSTHRQAIKERPPVRTETTTNNRSGQRNEQTRQQQPRLEQSSQRQTPPKKDNYQRSQPTHQESRSSSSSRSSRSSSNRSSNNSSRSSHGRSSSSRNEKRGKGH